VLGPLTYKMEFEDGRMKTIHVLFLKDNVERAVNRAITVLLEDSEQDSVLDGNRKVVVSGVEVTEDIEQWESEYADKDRQSGLSSP